jgi:hypothetical protein
MVEFDEIECYESERSKSHFFTSAPSKQQCVTKEMLHMINHEYIYDGNKELNSTSLLILPGLLIICIFTRLLNFQ